MERKDLRHLNRSDLVDIIYEIQNDSEEKSDILPDEQTVITEHDRITRKRVFRRTLGSTVAILLVVAAIAVLLSTLFLPIIQVSGDSMEPALHNGDILLLYKTKNYDCGELCCVSWQNKLLLKRVIGQAGDIIEMDTEGNVSVNNILLDEPYVTEKCLGECDITFPYQVPDDTLFLLGDRRDSSIDSRCSVVGCVNCDQVIGKVLFRLWPLGNFDRKEDFAY